MVAASAVFILVGIVLALFLLHAITIDSIKDAIMTATQDAVDALTAQLGKAKDEILAEVAALEAQVAAGEAPDLTALKAVVQSLDDLNADAEEPAEDPVAE